MASILATVASINDRHGNTNSDRYKFNDTNNNLYVTKAEVESDLNRSKRYHLSNSGNYSNNQLVRLDDVKWDSPIQIYYSYIMNMKVLGYLDTNLPYTPSYRHKVEYVAGPTHVSLEDMNLRFSTSSEIILSGEVNDRVGTFATNDASINIITDLNNNYTQSISGKYLRYGLEQIDITVKLEVIKKNVDTNEEIKSYSDSITTTLLGSSINIESVRDNFGEKNLGNKYQAGWRSGNYWVYTGLYDLNDIYKSEDNIFTMYLGAGYEQSGSSPNLILKLADLKLKYPTYDDDEYEKWGSKFKDIEVNWKLQQIE